MKPLTYRWRCILPLVPPHHTPCGAGGEGPGSDLAARKHTERFGHPTETRGVPHG